MARPLLVAVALLLALTGCSSDDPPLDTTPTRRYDYSGCDKEDNTKYNDLKWSISGDSITYFGVVVCRDAANGPCKVGGLSGRNPYA